MKLSSISITFFLVLLHGSSVHLVNSQQTDSCGSNLKLDVPFDTTSLHCLPVWSRNDFILRYVQTSSNVWSFVLSAPDTNSFIAMGFSSSGMMVGSSAMVGWISADGIGTVKQYFLGGQRPNFVLPDQGNLTVVSNSRSITSRSSRLYMAFQLNTIQPLSRLIYSVGQIAVIPSSPDYALAQHRDQVSTTLNYVTESPFKIKEEPWGTKHAELGDTDDNRSDDSSLRQAMGSDLVLLPRSDSVVRLCARDIGHNLRTCLRKSPQSRCLHPQRPRHLYTCAGMPPGNGSICKTKQGIEDEEILELVPLQRWEDSGGIFDGKCVLWDSFGRKGEW
ncbi:hypothetical protein V6N11_030861, partial [Hibiscus sabdariffa]